MLTSVRESYADIVSEGILSKNRLKTYFDALPGKTSTQREMYTIDLSNYQPVALRSSPITDPNNSQLKPAQAKGVEIALSEILPVVSFHNDSLLVLHTSIHVTLFSVIISLTIIFH